MSRDVSGFAVILTDLQHPSENEFCNGKHSQGFALCSPTKMHILNVSISHYVRRSDFLIYGHIQQPDLAEPN